MDNNPYGRMNPMGINPPTNPPPEPKPEEWMTPTNKVLWYRAFKKKAPQVKLRDGRVFNIDYGRRDGEVWVSPVKGLVPCGWFPLERVTTLDWVGS